MYIYLLYFLVFLIGILFPIKIENLIKVYIISLIFDDLRIEDISITNLVLTIFIIKTLYLIKQKDLLKVSKSTLYLIIFGFIIFLAFLISSEPGSLKSFISLMNLILSCFCISQIIKIEKHRKSVLDSIVLMSGIVALSVLAETVLFYVFKIGLRDSEFGLQNLSTYFYFSSGFFSSNGLAVFHIIPGLVIFLFNKNKNRKFHFLYKVLIWLGIFSTVTRGGIVVSLVALAILFFQYLRTLKNIYKYIGYSFLVVLVSAFSQLVIFVSNFNISSVVSRFFIINGAVNTIYQHPLLGTGLASQVVPITTDIDLFDNSFISDNVLNASENRETHNTLLQIGIETGFLGILAFAFFIIYLIRKVKLINKTILARRANDNQDIYATLFLLLFTLLAINMNSYLYMKLLWIIIGYISGINKKNISYI